MKRVGKIDRIIYSCVTEDIITDKVVLTDNQIEHVIEGHGDDYKIIKKYLKKDGIDILEVERFFTKPNSVVIIKIIKRIL